MSKSGAAATGTRDDLRAFVEGGGDRLRQVLEAARLGLWDWDLITNAVEFGGAWASMLGYELRDIEPHVSSWEKLVHPDDKAEAMRQIERHLRGEVDVYESRHRLLTKSGAWKWVLDRGRITSRDATGKPLRMVGVHQDIHEAKLTEEALERSRHEASMRLAEIEQVYAHAPIGLGVLDRELRFIRINERLAEMNGISASGHLGKTVSELLPGLPEIIPTLRRVLAGEAIRDVEVVGRTPADPDRDHTWLESWIPLVDASGEVTGVNIVCDDITQDKKWQEAVRQGEERLRLAQLAARLGYFEWDVPGGTLQWSQELGHLFGFEPGTFDGRLETCLRLVQPDDRERILRELDEWFASTRESFESEFRVRAVGPGDPDAAPPERLRCFAVRARVIRNSAGKPLRVIGTDMDVTDLRAAQEQLAAHNQALHEAVQRTRAELEESHRQLRVSERLSALGTLAAGVGHDMANVLVPMQVWLESLGTLDLSPQAQAHVRSLRESAVHLRSLSSGLRALTLDPQDTTRGPAFAEIQQWWKDTQGLLRAALPTSVTLESDGFDLPLRVAMPPHALTQVVFNLVQNAADALASRPAGRVRLRAEQDGHRVCVSVQDDGPGMDQAILARCLEPFYTTKARTKGTGLGLALVHTAVQRSGGEVSIESQAGSGTRVTLRLPMALASSTPPPVTLRVRVEDARTGAFARALGSSLGCTLWEEGETPPEVCVFDAATAPALVHGALDAGTRVICLGLHPQGLRSHPLLTTLEDNASLSMLRDALRARLREVREARPAPRAQPPGSPSRSEPLPPARIGP